ncbi:MAG: immune inhibitor A, partial [Flavobacteriaceae bacterium]|nr:immune inhibitor A [Flavobacteriaceae bacterium]
MKKIIVILLVLAINSMFAQDKKLYHRAKIYYENAEKFKQLELFGLALDHGVHKKDVFFESDFSENEIEYAKSIGLNVEIVIEDVRQFYLDQNDPQSSRYVGFTKNANPTCPSGGGATTYTTPANYNNGSMGGFLTYSEMLQELDDMYTYAQANGIDIITQRADITKPSNPTDLQTYEGRYLQWVKISDNPNTSEPSEPQILYDAIHHAREPASLQQLIFYMWYILENYNSDPEIQSIVNNTEMYFIPCVNPDGYIYNETTNPNGGGFWRKNRRDHGNGTFGVDNNRNYSYIDGNGVEVWNTTGTSGTSGGDTWAGTGPFSEPENRALRYFVETHNFTMALNNHTSGGLLLYPYGYANNQPTPDDGLYQTISAMMVSQNGYTNQISADLYPAAGDSDDFMYGMLTTEAGGTRDKVFAMTPEIGPSFWPAESSIIGICQDMMYHNITAAQLVGNYATLSDTSSQYISNTNPSINYAIQRLGLQAPANFTVSINPISANIVSVGAANAHNGMTLQQTINSSISMTLSPTINTGDTIQFELVLNNGLYDKIIPISKIFGQTVTILDEPGDNTGQWNDGGWAITTEDFYSSTSSITDSPNTIYGNNQDKSIDLVNNLDLTNAIAANLTFYAKWEVETNWDYVQVEVSTNNGVTWTPQCGNYTNEGVANQTGAENEPLYDGTQNTWIQESIDLSDYLGSTIRIRFRLYTDNTQRRDGFYFDDLEVNVIETIPS